MRPIHLLIRSISFVALAATLAFPLTGTGCATDVGTEESVADDDAAEVDETSLKEDSSIRPTGRFEVADFASLEDQGVRVGYTYGIDIRSDAGSGTRDYGVNEEQPTVIRREVAIRFTRSGSTRYIRLTESDAYGNETVARFEYKLSRGILRLRPTRTSSWFTMSPVAEMDREIVDAMKTYYTEEGEHVENAPLFQGRLPFQVQLEYDMVAVQYGEDGYAPTVSKQSFRDSQANRTIGFFMLSRDNDGGGMRSFFDVDGNYIAGGGYSESTDFSWDNE